MKRRVLTALVAIPLVLGVVGCTNPWPLAVVLIALALVSCVEMSAMFQDSPFGLTAIPGAMVLLVGLPSFEHWGVQGQEASGVLALFLLGLVGAGFLIRRPNQWAWLFLAGFWFGVPLLLLRSLHPGSGASAWGWTLPNPILLLLLPVWAGDTAAMLAGKAFGRHKLAPSISPNKTWEGAAANLIASLLTGGVVGFWLGYEPWVGWACGAGVGLFGQLGDLFESALKRSAGKKDSGALLPGHGGLLDRIDAMLGATVPVWLILSLSGSI